MKTAQEYVSGSEYYESQIHQIPDQTERLAYATLAQQQATLAVAAAICEAAALFEGPAGIATVITRREA